jgi:hypothetical protein
MADRILGISDGNRYRLSKQEREWVAAARDISAALLCIRYALVYARHQPEWLLEECTHEVEYRSQIVDNVHLGLDAVSQVFEERMSDPAWYPESGALPLIELATLPDGCPCGVLVRRQGRFDAGLGRPDFWMAFRCNAAGKVAGMQSGFMPSPLDLRRSGIFPGIPAAKLRREKQHEPSVFPAGVPLRFLYVHRKDDPDWLPSAEAAREAVRFFNMARLEIYPLELDLSQIDDARWLFNKGVRALPHLHIVYEGEDVLRLDGPFDRERLMNELYQRFCAPGGSRVEPGVMKGLLEDQAPGMGGTGRIQWLFYCDPERMEEILEAFRGDNPLAAQRAAYVLDRLSLIRKDVIQPHAELLLGMNHDDPNSARLRHVARMLPRLTLSSPDNFRTEQLLLNLAWQQRDPALQVFALESLRHFAKTNFHLREFAGPFVFDLMQRTRNGRVIREAELTLDTIEYFEEKVNEQWERVQAHA